MTENEDKSCLECGDKVRGRSDKKFCSDLCRNAYNNKLNRDENKYIRRVNSILRKNRKALAYLVEINKTKVQRKDLAELDFNFSYHTEIYTTKKGNIYKFCYDYGYLELSGDFLFIVKRKENLN